MRSNSSTSKNIFLVVLPILALVIGVVQYRRHDRSPNVEILSNLSAKNTAMNARAPASVNEDGKAKKGGPSAVSLNQGALCSSFEYPGMDQKDLKISTATWNQILIQFHDAKDEVLTWLHKSQMGVSAETLSAMEKQVTDLRIQRPPTFEEPDLTWRGIGVYTESDRENLIRLGGGFIKLMERDQKRARFELTRLIVQSWSPCELERISVQAKWDPLLECLGVKDEKGCSEGSYSDAGWAVSTVIASQVSSPACSIPAFKDQRVVACLHGKWMSTPPAATDTTAAIQHGYWQEARK